MATITRKIGLSLGADICWPAAYEEILARLDLAIPQGGDEIPAGDGAGDGRAVRSEPADAVQPRDGSADPLVPHEPRVDQDDLDGRRVRAQQPLGHPVHGEAHELRRDDAPRAAHPAHLDHPPEGVRDRRRLGRHRQPLQPAVRSGRGRRVHGLPRLPQALRRRRLGRRDAGDRRGVAARGLRSIGQARPPPAGRGQGLGPVRPGAGRGPPRST